MREIPRERRPVVALAMLTASCTMATLAFKQLAAVFCLLGLLCGLAGLILAAQSRPTVNGRRAWGAVGVLGTLAGIAAGYAVTVIGR